LKVIHKENIRLRVPFSFNQFSGPFFRCPTLLFLLLPFSSLKGKAPIRIIPVGALSFVRIPIQRRKGSDYTLLVEISGIEPLTS